MQHHRLPSTHHATVAAALCTASTLAIGWTSCALAQDTPPPATTATQGAQAYVDNGDIIVTARKRQESILKVPVVVTAVSEQQLQSVGITQVTELPKLVPGLVISGNLLSIGPQVTIRGVGTSSYDPGVDQSVSLNIDGLGLGQGLAFGSAMFDVAQVEVLKGPQSLFFGKSTPGGVISIRTADPGDHQELTARASYEFESREIHGELIASSPISDTLGLRFAGAFTHGDGWFENKAVPAPGTGALAPYDREPRPRNVTVRTTLLWKPTDTFSARAKINYVYDHMTDSELAQLAHCPDGPGQAFAPPIPANAAPIPFIGGDDCKLDRDLHIVYLDPKAFPNLPNNGVPYLQNEQTYGTLELNYDAIPAISLSSTTAFYRLQSSSMVNPTHTTAAAPTFAVTNRFHRYELTQEVRANSDFSGPLNFTLGAYYEDGQIYDRVHFIRNTAYTAFNILLPPTTLNDDRATTVDIKTYSGFGQLRWKIFDQLELSGGVRYTDETRREHVYDYQFNQDLTPFLPRTKVHSSTWSPEATITYTPNDDITAFASYKKGFKSGSFKLAVPANVSRDATGAIRPGSGENNAFDDEKVEGYEIGLKTRLFDRSLLFNLAFYDYRYNGLQVGGIEPPPGGFGSPIINTVNAGRARSYGVDVDMSYRPPVEGLTLNAALNWNRARYEDLTRIGCYYNQLFQEGCSLSRVENGATLRSQQLSGTPMIRAPEWAANFGFNYELPVGSGLKLALANNNQYSDDYVTFPAVGRPNNDNIQPSYFKIDASLALKDENDRWEIALLGKNLTDKIIASNCSATNFAGGILLPFGGDNAGGTTRGSGGFAEEGCFADGPGRTIMLRLTVRPFK